MGRVAGPGAREEKSRGPEPAEAGENEDKTLVYLGVAGLMLLIGGALVVYIMKIGGRR